MCIDSLEKPQNDPKVYSDDVKVAGKVTVQEGTEDCAGAKNEDLGGVGILSGEAKGRGIFVVDFVNVFVQNTSVESLVSCTLGKHWK